MIYMVSITICVTLYRDSTFGRNPSGFCCLMPCTDACPQSRYGRPLRAGAMHTTLGVSVCRIRTVSP